MELYIWHHNLFSFLSDIETVLEEVKSNIEETQELKADVAGIQELKADVTELQTLKAKMEDLELKFEGMWQITIPNAQFEFLPVGRFFCDRHF